MIGMEKSLIIQQLHTWLRYDFDERNVHRGVRWLQVPYVSIDHSRRSWREVFPFWPEGTIRSLLGELENAGILRCKIVSEPTDDLGPWYTIEYDCIKPGSHSVPGHHSTGAQESE
jgi:hypothetical protein